MTSGKLLHGDALDILKTFDSNSVDEIITDPPYGYSFMCKDWDKAIISVELWKECLRLLKPGAFAFIMSAPRQDVLSHMIVNLTDAGFKTDFTSMYWAYATGFPKAANISKMVYKKLGEKRKRLKIQEAGKNSVDYGKYSGEIDDSAPITNQAKKLDGAYAGFQPKPAVEVILVCMKPLSEKNYVEQAISNGKGITWLDDCRIPHNEIIKPCISSGSERLGSMIKGHEYTTNNQGRFPANLLVSDDALNDGNNHKVGLIQKHHSFTSETTKNTYGKYKRLPASSHVSYGDSGSFSRYFDLDKWDAQFIIIPKPSKAEKNKGLDNFIEHRVGDGRKIDIDNAFQRGKTERKNTHPTVKPVSLMKYLVTLGSRKNDTVLDPFIGSGTLGIACNELHRSWIGIEKNMEYIEIAKYRTRQSSQKMNDFI